GPLYEVDHNTGLPFYSYEIEFEGVSTVQEIPGMLEGGLILHGRTDVALLVEAWGEVTRTPGTIELTYGAISVEATTVAYGPAEITDLLIHPVPGNPAAVVIDFINDYQAPPPAEPS